MKIIITEKKVIANVVQRVVTATISNQRGPQGAPGQGVPSGGTTGQVLAKSSNSNYDTAWVNQTGGGGGAVQSVNNKTGIVILNSEDVGASPTVHTHCISDITGLQTALDGKQVAGDYAAAIHSHVISDVSGLQTALDGKAANVHTHTISNITGLQTALDGKQAAGSYANAVHIHTITDVTGLQAALDGKQPVGSYASATHTHTSSSITDFNTAASAAAPVQSVAGKTGTVTLVKGDVGLGNVDNVSDLNKPISTATQTALNGKAATVHTHVINDVTGLQTALDAKLAASVFSDGVEQTYTETPSWTGTTAPSGTTGHFYRRTQIGKLNILNIVLKYSVAGASLTQVTLPLPADCPVPAPPTGFTGNGNGAFWGSGGFAANPGAAISNNNKVNIGKDNSSPTGWSIGVLGASNTSSIVNVTLIYWSV